RQRDRLAARARGQPREGRDRKLDADLCPRHRVRLDRCPARLRRAETVASSMGRAPNGLGSQRMKGWSILIGALLVGVIVGFVVANRGPALIAPYVSKSSSGAGEHIEGQVVRKQREGNRLLVKIN